jgi:hypothetical protein
LVGGPSPILATVGSPRYTVPVELAAIRVGRPPREETMTLEGPRTNAHRNPAAQEEARALVNYVESLFVPWNVEALVAGFQDVDARPVTRFL